MYRIIDSRSTGKTSRLLLLAKETDSTIVCKNPQALLVKAKNYGIEGIKVAGYQDVLEYSGAPENILIDDLEEFAKFVASPLELIGYNLSRD